MDGWMDGWWRQKVVQNMVYVNCFMYITSVFGLRHQVQLLMYLATLQSVLHCFNSVCCKH